MIRPFRLEDARLCNAVIRSCVEKDPSLSPRLRQRLLNEETPELMSRRAGLFYLAVYESSARVVGLGGLDLNELRLLYVAPEAQGLGIGRSVLRHLEDMVPRDLFADVFVYASPSAEGFYSRCGYRRQGEWLFDLEEEALQTIFMTKPTAPKPAGLTTPD